MRFGGKSPKLKQRVFEEMEICANQYETVMAIVRREHYDPSNETLYPVLEADDAVQQAFTAAGCFPGSFLLY